MKINTNFKTTEDPIQSSQSSNNTVQVFKPDVSKLLDLTTFMINKGDIKTDIEFAKKFMFSFDSEEKYPINLELLVEMKVYDRKDNAKSTLVKTFTVDVDYIFVKTAPPLIGAINMKGKGGQNKETVFLTVECFKTMCMIVRNDIGRQTQRYYLDLEKVFKTYMLFEFQQNELQLQEAYKKIQLTETQLQIKDKEITKINTNHQQLLKRQKRTVYEVGNVVYLISNDAFTTFYEDDYEKYGKATQKSDEDDPAFMRRLSNYNTSSPENFNVDSVFYVKDNALIEKCIEIR